MIVGRLTIANLIRPELQVYVALKVPVRDKIACLKTFIHILCEADGISGEQKKEMTTALLRRERLGTTGVGGGIAIPHAKCRIDSFYFIIGVLTDAIDFNAIDDHPVDVVATYLAPHYSGADHLKLLAYISRLLRDKNYASALRKATSLQDISIVLRGDFEKNRYERSIVHEEVFSETDWEALISSWVPEKRRIRGGRCAKARG